LASGSSDSTVRLWEPITGKELRRLRGHRGLVQALAFSGDGRRLASGGLDTSVLVWDVAGLVRRPTPANRLPAKKREALWADLAGDDAARAYQAMGTLLAHRAEGVRFLGERLRPVTVPSSRQVARRLADLDSDDFTVREQATAELTKLGDAAEPAVRKALAGRPSAEARRRLERLLEVLDRATSPERVRALRAVEVLEQAGLAEARQVLGALAGGAPGARLTQAAQAALERLAGRPAPTP
jgi:hypothetical protein